MKYVPQITASVWMPFKQTCDEESNDADFDSFKTAPWDAGGTQRDKLHEVMCRRMVHNVDRWTTRNTERELATKMLMDTSCPRLTMTPGEDDASYGGTQIRGELRDTLDISDGHIRRKDDDILRRSALCVEIVIPADMKGTRVELNDVTILRRRLPWRQDSAQHDECYTSVTNTAVEFNDVVFLYFFSRYQQDMELKRKECKERFGCTQSGNCTHCGKYIQMDLGKHIAFYHLELAQLWRCPVMWCTVWKGTAQDCIDHMRRAHKLPLSVKAANLAKYFPARTVSRVEWSKMLMPCVSGVAIDTLLFSRVGSPLCHQYRLISRTGSHTTFRDTYLKRLWSFIEEMDSAGRRQGPVGLTKQYLLGW